MMRAIVVAMVLAGCSGAAVAQDAGAEPAGDPVATAVERVRADFNARLVDYDQRIKSLEARLEALEAAEAPPPDAPASPPPAAN